MINEDLSFPRFIAAYRLSKEAPFMELRDLDYEFLIHWWMDVAQKNEVLLTALVGAFIQPIISGIIIPSSFQCSKKLARILRREFKTAVEQNPHLELVKKGRSLYIIRRQKDQESGEI